MREIPTLAWNAFECHVPGSGRSSRPGLDLRGVGKGMTMLYRIGRYLVESEFWPNGYEGNEFRALRDKQRPQ